MKNQRFNEELSRWFNKAMSMSIRLGSVGWWLRLARFLRFGRSGSAQRVFAGARIVNATVCVAGVFAGA